MPRVTVIRLSVAPHLHKPLLTHVIFTIPNRSSKCTSFLMATLYREIKSAQLGSIRQTLEQNSLYSNFGGFFPHSISSTLCNGQDNSKDSGQQQSDSVQCLS